MAAAGGMFGGFGLGASSSRISSLPNYEDEITGTFRNFGGYSFTENLSIETGYLYFTNIAYGPRQDAVSEYSLSLERHDLYLAPAFEFKPQRFIPVRLMAGVTYSLVRLSIEESFYDSAPAGKTTRNDAVLGGYFSAGIVPFDFSHVHSLVSFEYIVRPNVFSESDRSFRSEEFLLRFSLYFH